MRTESKNCRSGRGVGTAGVETTGALTGVMKFQEYEELESELLEYEQ